MRELTGSAKPAALAALLDEKQQDTKCKVMVFCNTKIDCERQSQARRHQGHGAVAIHGDKVRDVARSRARGRARGRADPIPNPNPNPSPNPIPNPNPNLASPPTLTRHALGRARRAARSTLHHARADAARRARASRAPKGQGEVNDSLTYLATLSMAGPTA